ncbi:unnamed protein product, partial [Amoebophrya sp. A25]
LGTQEANDNYTQLFGTAFPPPPSEAAVDVPAQSLAADAEDGNPNTDQREDPMLSGEGADIFNKIAEPKRRGRKKKQKYDVAGQSNASTQPATAAVPTQQTPAQASAPKDGVYPVPEPTALKCVLYKANGHL